MANDLVSSRVTATRRLEWDAGHRVLRHESKCATLHGHRYEAEVTVEADRLDSVGRVVDFGVIKERVGSWIDDKWDHTTLVNQEDVELVAWCTRDATNNGNRRPYIFPCEPTAENIAATLVSVATTLFAGTEIRVVRVRVWETPNCYADAVPAAGA